MAKQVNTLSCSQGFHLQIPQGGRRELNAKNGPLTSTQQAHICLFACMCACTHTHSLNIRHYNEFPSQILKEC